jgi:hypothetical protein
MKTKIDKRGGSLVLMILALTMPALGQESSPALEQLQAALPEAAAEAASQVPSVAAAPARIQNGTELQYYQGIMDIGGDQRPVCFSLSPDEIDRYAGDADLPHGVFVSQDIPRFLENGKECGSSLEHNGDYIRTCSGLFLTGAGSLARGDVFARLDRFDPQTGALSAEPVGTYQLQRVDSCQSPASPAAVSGPACSIRIVDTMDKTSEVVAIQSAPSGAGAMLYRILRTGPSDETQTVVRGDNDPIEASDAVPHPTRSQLRERYRTGAEAVSRAHKYTTANGQLIYTVEPGSSCSSLDAALLMFWIDEFFYFG